ncbi:MAG: zinc ribbon domain-containing protein [Ruthenibacterium lactatiformans]
MRYPLSGKVVCGNCGAHYNRRTRYGRNSIPRYTWQCVTHQARESVTAPRARSRGDAHRPDLRGAGRGKSHGRSRDALMRFA